MSRDGLSYTKGLLMVYLLAGAAAALANDTFTPEFNQLVNGKPIQAIRDAYYNQIGGIVYVIAFVGVFLGLYIRIQNLTYCVMLLDIGAAIFWQYTFYPLDWLIYIVNALAIANIIFKPFSPILAEG